MSYRARRHPRLAVALTLLMIAMVAACKDDAGSPRATNSVNRPNIVFILTDDLSWNLVQYMPHVLQMEKDGTTFSNYVVTDSLCCPSRSSIFTGDFPHDTGVFTNNAPDGGFDVFHSRGDESHTYATALQANRYATAMMGKYLNGYQPKADENGQNNYVPPGWSEWDVAGNGYPEFDYDLNVNHTIIHHGHLDSDYLTDVINGAGVDFIREKAATKTPFVLELATFAPHSPYTPAPVDSQLFARDIVPRTPAYNTLPTNPPSWLAGIAPLTPKLEHNIDLQFRKRAEAVQAVDRMIRDVRAALVAAGVAKNTYIVFSSDNGFHMGEYRLLPGKQTAFDVDVRVPLVVVGPGVPAGATRDQIVQNTDLAPTFEELSGVAVPSNVDGRSIVALLGSNPPSDWRTAALIEHHHGPDVASDPDEQPKRNGAPPTYEALRTATYTYVEYANGEKEFYDRSADPDELHNTAGTLPPDRLAALHAALVALENCHGGAACWAAGHVPIP